MKMPMESTVRYKELKARMDAGEHLDLDDYIWVRKYQRAWRVIGRADARRWRHGNNIVQQAKYGPMVSRGV